MSAPKMKVFCNLQKWVEQEHPTLAMMLDNLCIKSRLSSKGKQGMTIIIPHKKDIAQLEKLAYGDTVEEAKKAVNILRAHILPMSLVTAMSWKANQANLPNDQMPNGNTEFKSANGDEVTLAGVGDTVVKIVPVTSYKIMAANQTTSVWEIKEGSLKWEGLKPATVPERGSKVGGMSEESVARAKTDIRTRIILEAEVTFAHDMVTGSQMTRFSNIPQELKEFSDVVPGKKRNVFAEMLASLIQYALNADVVFFVERILPLISYSIMDLYYLLEPYGPCSKNGYLLDDTFVYNWWSSYKLNPIIDMISILQANDKFLGSDRSSEPYAYLSKSGKYLAAVKRKTDAIFESDATSADSKGMQLCKLYGEVINTNSIGDIKDIWPVRGCLEIWRECSCLKMLQDELRMMAACKLHEWQNQFDLDEWTNFTLMIERLLKCGNAERQGALPISRPKMRLNTIMDCNADFLNAFLRSTFVLQIPISVSVKDCTLKMCNVINIETNKFMNGVATSRELTMVPCPTALNPEKTKRFILNLMAGGKISKDDLIASLETAIR
jgi:hypothetical protein